MKKLKYLLLFSILFVPSFALGFTQSPTNGNKPGIHFPGCSTSDKIGDGGCDIECTNGFVASCSQREGRWDCWWNGGGATGKLDEGFGSPCTW